jgi:hypothetical protein
VLVLMKRRGKRKNYPKRHSYKIDDVVVFVFAGSKRLGKIIEKTWEEVGVDPKAHATYVISSGGTIYPCVGLDGSKEFGNIISFDTKEGRAIRTIQNPHTTQTEHDERGYKHLPLPKLKEMCKKNKLKVSGSKKELVERLEKWYYETSHCGVSTDKKVNDSFFA